jgi:hypothetical protein
MIQGVFDLFPPPEATLQVCAVLPESDIGDFSSKALSHIGGENLAVRPRIRDEDVGLIGHGFPLSMAELASETS